MKVEGIKCKGNPEDTCIITKDVKLGNMIFDKCETCYGTFNVKYTDEKVKKDKKTSQVRMDMPKIVKEKRVEHIFPHHWYMSDGYPAPGIEKTELTVLSTFSCGGGSTMGYKLAGMNVIGCVEIDPNMLKCYEENHHPKYPFLSGVKEFVERINENKKKFKEDYPELFNLDILDGSPPCSSFSLAGLREKAWGKKKKFREGQSDQVLDTLYFDFIELAFLLKPKVIVSENVPGILMGTAIEYVKRIYKDMDEAGYEVKHFRLMASDMGVPQKRERVFFIGIRKDLLKHFEGGGLELFSMFPPLDLRFNEPDISFERATRDFWEEPRKPLTETATKYYFKIDEGKSFSDKHENGSLFNWMKVSRNSPVPTLAAGNRDLYFHPVKEGVLNEREYMALGSYPLDYNSLDQDVKYLVGMSVPPVMMAQIALRIKKQWFDVINKAK